MGIEHEDMMEIETKLWHVCYGESVDGIYTFIRDFPMFLDLCGRSL